MDKSKMKEIRKHVRQTDLAEQSTQPHAIGPDGVEHNKDLPTTDDIIAYNRKQDSQVEAYNEYLKDEPFKVSKEVLNELWTSDKILKDGYWYIKLTDVIKILGDYDTLYEKESK